MKKYDLVIKNGYVVLENETTKILNIGINKNIIEDITESDIDGVNIIDASGKIVSPGFIDVHSHSDIIPLLMDNANSKVYQGVTTEINGNCGLSPIAYSKAKLDDIINYSTDNLAGINFSNFDLEKIDSVKTLIDNVSNVNHVINQGYLIGAGTVRIATVGFENKELSANDMNDMLGLIDSELKNGALGISFGLIYPPGSFTTIKEIINIAQIVAKHNKIIVFHMRNEADFIKESIEEVITISKEARVKAHISHLKIMSKKLWGESDNILKLIKKANENGADLTYDQYPYNASSTTLQVLVPEKYFSNGIESMIKHLDYNDDILDEINHKIEMRGGAKNILISHIKNSSDNISGKTLYEIAESLNTTFSKACIEILKNTNGNVNAIFFSMNDNDVINILKEESGIIASDGYNYPMNIENTKDLFGLPHPRSFGTFPRFLKIVRENSLLTLEKSIAKITSIPARRFGIEKRGFIKIGYYADITIFDFEKIKDSSTFEQPFQKPLGIEYVIVNGKIVIEGSCFNNKKSGMTIK